MFAPSVVLQEISVNYRRDNFPQNPCVSRCSTLQSASPREEHVLRPCLIPGSSCKPVSSPSAGHRSGGANSGGAGAKGSKAGGPRLLGVASDVLASPDVDQVEDDQAEELLEDPLPWKESMSTGKPLFYSKLLRQQAIALQVRRGQ